ncbi:hypothetical protein CAPTEDRAFT_217523 [Capitella teleta]|uniref:Uncharacterized protein n=1 Tax=Capitella teleta TaxID=283909 RepID=R7UHW2_CAPTE|nr:hypothetical protein CAPTEDRAFT_217523 [Capitella teleta]|eukprot:ELU05673.1 hypothetical protein CAPTEDRAFT_217523 [Capitella teleta]
METAKKIKTANQRMFFFGQDVIHDFIKGSTANAFGHASVHVYQIRGSRQADAACLILFYTCCSRTFTHRIIRSQLIQEREKTGDMDVWRELVVLVILVMVGESLQQKVECKQQADIAFVVDSSGSIKDGDPNNWDRIKTFIRNIVEKLDIGEDMTRIGAVVFSNIGKVEFNLNKYYDKNSVVNAILDMQYGGGNTNTSGGIYMMLTEIFVEDNGDRPNVPDTAIVITDGVSTRDSDKTIPYAIQAKDRGIRMLAVGIGAEINEDELEGIASPPDATTGQTVFTVQNFDKLTNILDKLVTQTCIVITTPAPTNTPIPDPDFCQQEADVVVVLDASGSVGYDNFERMKDFTSGLVELLDIDSGRVRLGLLVFASNPQRLFQMSHFQSRAQMLPQVKQASYIRGTTNTAAAIRFVYQNMFTPAHGDRNRVQDVMILVTDGASDDKEETLDAAREARRRGIHIFVVAVGNWLDVQEINAIATYPYEKNRVQLENFRSLNEDFARRMKDLVCNSADECASNPCANAIICNDAPGYFYCTCSEGYAGPTCNQVCRSSQDIVFALDASGSIGKENFERMVDFVRKVIDGIRIGTSDSFRPSRVGLLVYSDNAEVLFNLNDFDSKFEIQNALPPYYREGSTNTADALRVMRETMFTERNGDQPAARNIGILMTDGRSNDEAKTWEEALKTRAAGIDLISIGIGPSIRTRELEGIATAPNEEGKNAHGGTTIDINNRQQVRDVIYIFGVDPAQAVDYLATTGVLERFTRRVYDLGINSLQMSIPALSTVDNVNGFPHMDPKGVSESEVDSIIPILSIQQVSEHHGVWESKAKQVIAI